MEGHTDSVVALSFAADADRLLSAAADGTVLVWDLPSGEMIARFATGDDIGRCVTRRTDGRV